MPYFKLLHNLQRSRVISFIIVIFYRILVIYKIRLSLSLSQTVESNGAKVARLKEEYAELDQIVTRKEEVLLSHDLCETL